MLQVGLLPEEITGRFTVGETLGHYTVPYECIWHCT